MFHSKLWVVLGALQLLLASHLFAADNNRVSEERSCQEEGVMVIAQAATPEEPASGNIQERAVPRMGPGAGVPPITRLEGGVLEGNRLRANPGYTLQPMPGGKVMLRPIGGGNSVEASCRCPKGSGCSLEVEGGLATCRAAGTCKQQCLMVLGSAMSGGLLQRQ